MSPTASSSSSKSPSNTPSSAPTPAISDAELDKLLSREASAFQREIEVERILKAFKLKCVHFLPFIYFYLTSHIYSPYDILDIPETATQEEIKRRYRQLSLCEFLSHSSVFAVFNLLPVIHPDKTPHARAPEAFDILKKACISSFILRYGANVSSG